MFRAGRCAYGPTFTLDATDLSSGATLDRSVTFGFTTLGLSSSAPFELPFDVVEPSRPGCV